MYEQCKLNICKYKYDLLMHKMLSVNSERIMVDTSCSVKIIIIFQPIIIVSDTNSKAAGLVEKTVALRGLHVWTENTQEHKGRQKLDQQEKCQICQAYSKLKCIRNVNSIYCIRLKLNNIQRSLKMSSINVRLPLNYKWPQKNLAVKSGRHISFLPFQKSWFLDGERIHRLIFCQILVGEGE